MAALSLLESVMPQQTLSPVSMADYQTRFGAFSRDLAFWFKRYGFAVVADHGLDSKVISAALAEAKAFFALPEGVKRAYQLPGGAGQRGYTPFGVETAKGAQTPDLKEFWHVGRELPADSRHRSVMPDNVWPNELPGFRPAVWGMFEALDDLGKRILRAIAHDLGLTDDYFDDRVRHGNSVLRLLHYPPVGADAPGVRAGAHEDINVITLLLGAEEAGLELLDRDGRWLAIAPPPDCIVVNIGDMLQRLTNHVLPSTTHRVVNPPPERRGFSRYSTPYFLHFEPDVLIRTLPSCITPDTPDRYPAPITAQSYLEERLREIKLA